jgi:hypothetical protein
MTDDKVPTHHIVSDEHLLQAKAEIAITDVV